MRTGPGAVSNALFVAEAYELLKARYGEEDFESAMETAIDPREKRGKT